MYSNNIHVYVRVHVQCMYSVWWPVALLPVPVCIIVIFSQPLQVLDENAHLIRVCYNHRTC